MVHLSVCRACGRAVGTKASGRYWLHIIRTTSCLRPRSAPPGALVPVRS